MHPARLSQPWALKKASRIFVCSAGDLFDPVIPFEFVEQVFQETRQSCHHTYFVLTKRPERMKAFFEWLIPRYRVDWPQQKVWLGVTVTDQQDADERVLLLLQVPAAHRFVSFEPLLGPIRVSLVGVGWAIIGGQTGPGAVALDPQWVADLTAQCDAAGIPVYYKSSLAPLGFTRKEKP